MLPAIGLPLLWKRTTQMTDFRNPLMHRNGILRDVVEHSADKQTCTFKKTNKKNFKLQCSTLFT